MTQKLTNRANERDPFGVNTFVNEAQPGWFPGGTKPPMGPPALLAPSVEATPTSPSGLHTLGAYKEKLVAEAAAKAPTLAEQQPSLLGGQVKAPQPSSSTQPPPTPPTPQPPAISPAALSGTPTPAQFQDQMKLELLRGMFPQHVFTPVEYDPFKVVPQGLGEKVDVNRGVG